MRRTGPEVQCIWTLVKQFEAKLQVIEVFRGCEVRCEQHDVAWLPSMVASPYACDQPSWTRPSCAATEAGTASITLTDEAVGTTRARRKSALASRSRYSSSVRSCPRGLLASMIKSRSLPGDGSLGPGRTVSTISRRPPDAMARRQFPSSVGRSGLRPEAYAMASRAEDVQRGVASAQEPVDVSFRRRSVAPQARARTSRAASAALRTGRSGGGWGSA